LTGEALGRAADADALVADFEARAAAVGAAIGATGQTASIVRFIPGQTRLYGPTTFSGSVLTQVGFDLGDKGYDPAVGMALLSAEQLEMVDADVIFATTFAGEGSARPDFEALWANLPAVAEGRQFDVEDSTWMSGIGVLGANEILDDLEAWLG
jgi:iron complex transport system substrate-binding protein